jgi:hypothetical protein
MEMALQRNAAPIAAMDSIPEGGCNSDLGTGKGGVRTVVEVGEVAMGASRMSKVIFSGHFLMAWNRGCRARESTSASSSGMRVRRQEVSVS